MSAQAQQSPDAGAGDELTLRDLYEECKGRPRSERVKILFNFEPTEYQANLLDRIEGDGPGRAAPQKGRQVGATLTAGVIGADHALWAPLLVGEATDVLFTAPGQETADEMFEECKQHFKNGPLTLEQYGVVTKNEQTWKFASGTRILSRTLGNVGQDDQPGNRGKNPTCVVVDEAAYEQDRVYEQEIEQFFITHPTFEYLLFSTPAGESGYFYTKVEHDDDWYSPHWPTKISPYAQQEYIDEQREKLPDSVFKQEFLGQFEPDGDSAIPHSTLNPNIVPDREFITSRARYLGIDPARGGDDEMVAFDMDECGTCWNAWAFETISGPQFVEFLEAVHTGKEDLEYWNVTPSPAVGEGQIPTDGYATILIEENGVGGFAADFAEAGLGSVIKVVNSTNETKQNIYQRLTKDLEAVELELPKYKPLIRQTTKLEKAFTPTGKAKYAAPTGKHDDWPDGMGFANWARHGGGEELDVEADNPFIISR
ncbi:hypothetical protein [Halostagnicola sp. A-GB9-2]|uniref:hypothetical protein n=1 Tax=Halostagnicola sp. A-GB9-2 TaxID=3048066 RepID=UPI0024C0DD5B|nr:hypothetical protein [Halostagnicola sp. A-GB9-2]MDJ1433601.1 hypothetical protein [Halostagnicola sp. A-GB9-2]